MAMRRDRQASFREWFADFGQYLLLIIVAAITIFLVVLAFNRPMISPSNGSSQAPTASNTADATPAPTQTPSSAPTTVAFLGDSYTSGDGTTSVDTRWSTQLSSANDWTEVNAGVAETGYGTAGVTAEARPYTERVADIVAATPDIVVVSGGRFDYSGSSSASAVSAAITDTFADLRAGLPEAQIIAIGPLWDASDTPARLAEITAEVQTAVEAVDGTFIDAGQPLEGRPELIADDGIAPNDEGHTVLFETIRAALEPVATTAP
jgi:lysophospholipase L1-like esterase